MSQFDANKDYYSILGVEEDATRSEIERLYRRLAVRHHPDRGGSEEEMKTLNEAYGVLRNQDTRRAYDAERLMPVDETAPPYSSPSAKADAISGQAVRALLCLVAGLFLLVLVRMQWDWYIWPLAVLASLVITMGVLMAHSVMTLICEALAAPHRPRRFVLLQETLFWSAVGGGVYGIYFVLSAV